MDYGHRRLLHRRSPAVATGLPLHRRRYALAPKRSRHSVDILSKIPGDGLEEGTEWSGIGSTSVDETRWEWVEPDGVGATRDFEGSPI